MATKLKAYMGFSRSGGSAEAACLVFAPDRKTAKRATHRVLEGWSTDHEYIDTAVREMRGKPYLFAEADPDKLERGEVHVIESPKTCPSCGQWGHVISAGQCEGCREWLEDK